MARSNPRSSFFSHLPHTYETKNMVSSWLHAMMHVFVVCYRAKYTGVSKLFSGFHFQFAYSHCTWISNSQKVKCPGMHTQVIKYQSDDVLLYKLFFMYSLIQCSICCHLQQGQAKSSHSYFLLMMSFKMEKEKGQSFWVNLNMCCLLLFSIVHSK